MLRAGEEKFAEQMHKFNLGQNGGISWSAALRNPETEELTFHKMTDRPCYGEMRMYGKDSTRPYDDKPSDLTKPFRKDSGIREACGVYFTYIPYMTAQQRTSVPEIVKFLFSEESPWRRGLPEQEHIEFTLSKGDEYPIGVVFRDTEYDPTVAVSLFIMMRSISNFTPSFQEYRKRFPDLSLSEVMFLALYCPIYNNKLPGSFGYSYTMPPKIDLRRWKHGTVQELSEGKTWRDGYDYNRPDMAKLFQPESRDMNLPTTLWTWKIMGGVPAGADLTHLPAIVENFRKLYAEA